jgi:hypothetical protein
MEVDEIRLAAVFADEGTFLHTENPTRKELATAVTQFIEAVVTRYEREKGWAVD